MSSLTTRPGSAGLFWCCAGGDRSAGLSSCDASEDLPLRLSQSHPVEPAARTGDPTQHRADVEITAPPPQTRDPIYPISTGRWKKQAAHLKPLFAEEL